MFFIFGMPRSGTTLLAQCLNAHSAIVVPHETDFIIPMAFLFDRIGDERVGRELIAKMIVSSAAFPNSLGEYIDAAAVEEVVSSCAYHPAAVLEGLYAKIAAAAGARLAGDKSPNDLNFLRMLVKTGGLDSSMKIIHIVRDIRDLMISVNRAGWVSDLDLYFPRFWCNQNLYLHSLHGQDPSRYVLTRYEDLVANPETEMTRLIRFLGFEFEPAMLTTENRHSRYIGDEAHANLYLPISPRSVGRYKDTLDPDMINNYERQAREGLEAFGYSLEGSPQPSRTGLERLLTSIRVGVRNRFLI